MRGDLVFMLTVLALLLASMPVYAVRRDAAATDPLESKARGTFVLGSFVRSWWSFTNKAARPEASPGSIKYPVSSGRMISLAPP